MFAFLASFSVLAHWRGRYTAGEVSEGPTRFEPWKRFIPDDAVWILDSAFVFGLDWVLYDSTQRIRKSPPEWDPLELYFSPRWRQVNSVILEEPEIEEWQVPVDIRQRFKVVENWQVPVDIRQRFKKARTLPRVPETLRPQKMVLIPAGRFLMGSNEADPRADEQPVRSVYVDAFYMDTTEVTNAQFKVFVDANPAWQKDRIAARYTIDHWTGNNTDYLRHWTGNNYPEGSGNYPVTHVSWYAAMAYAEWAGKRLPTEAEWEYAARGGFVGKKYPNGDTMTLQDAHYLTRNTAPVARYPPNGYGLHDMAGNAWEWCLDAYYEDFYATFPKDGVAQNPLSGANDVEWLLKNWRTAKGERILRGTWSPNLPHSLRVAARVRASAEWSGYAYGFRCVRSVSP